MILVIYSNAKTQVEMRKIAELYKKALKSNVMDGIK